MIPLGRSATEQHALIESLLDSHSIAVTVHLLDMDGNRVGDLTHLLLDGQIDFDGDADISRSCSLELLDVGGTFSFDSDSPADTALYLDRMVRVIYDVKVPGVGWIDIPVFTGPITTLDRGEATISVECQGKEALSSGPAWTPKTYKKGTRKVDVIRSILTDLSGETKFDLPAYTATLSEDLSIAREDVPWTVCLQLATSMNKQLFYDGRGICRLRRLPGNSVFTFRHGDGGAVMSEPDLSFDLDSVTNIVWVKGAVPEGAKTAVSYWYSIPNSHPLSPEKLGRNGVPRYLLEIVEEDSINSEAAAKALATTTLDEQVRDSIDVSFQSLPIPFLEPGDLAEVVTERFATIFRISQMSLPLAVGEVMTVGYTRSLSSGVGSDLSSGTISEPIEGADEEGGDEGDGGEDGGGGKKKKKKKKRKKKNKHKGKGKGKHKGGKKKGHKKIKGHRMPQHGIKGHPVRRQRARRKAARRNRRRRRRG